MGMSVRGLNVRRLAPPTLITLARGCVVAAAWRVVRHAVGVGNQRASGNDSAAGDVTSCARMPAWARERFEFEPGMDQARA
jgi:hypothetical protein